MKSMKISQKEAVSVVVFVLSSALSLYTSLASIQEFREKEWLYLGVIVFIICASAFLTTIILAKNEKRKVIQKSLQTAYINALENSSLNPKMRTNEYADRTLEHAE